MAVSYDNSATIVHQAQHPGSGSNGTLATGSGSNRQAAVGILNAYVGTPINITAVTVGTDSLSLISGTKTSGSGLQIEVWGGALTVTGNQTVTITWTGGDDNGFAAFAVQCSNTDLINNGATATSTASPVSLGMTSPSGDSSFTWHINNGTGAATTNQSRQYTETTPVDPMAADAKTTVGNVDPTHTWSTGGLDWSKAFTAGINFRQVASASVPTGDFGGPACSFFRVRLRDY